MRREAICIEGRDGVGKNSATLATIACLLQNKKSVVVTNFPQYWFLGNFIRLMNRGKADTVLTKIEPRRQALVRCLTFVLDRATTIPFLDKWFIDDPQRILVSDRGPDSNAITLSYMLAKKLISYDELISIINTDYYQLERELRNFLSIKSVQCKTLPELEDLIHDRKQLDDYESADIQVVIDSVYKLVKPTEILTKIDGSWRKYDDIARDAVGNCLGGSFACENVRDFDFMEAFNKSELQILGPNEILPFLENACDINCLRKYSELTDKWLKLSLSYEYTENGANKKELLDLVESEICIINDEQLMKNEGFLDFMDSCQTYRSAVKRIISEFPELIDIIDVVGYKHFASYLKRF